MDAPGLVKHFVCSAFLVLVMCSSLWSQERLPSPSEGQASSAENGDNQSKDEDATFKLREEAEYFDEFISLGTPIGLGGADWQRFERNHTKDLIRSFIPPLLRPAFVGHAFVLPPKAWQLSATGRLATIEGDDFFRNGNPNTKVFDNFEVDRQFFDLDLFYGFDLGREYLHNFTMRLSIPVSSAQTQGFVHPNGLPALSVFNEGENFELGDVGLFLKKKFVDQAAFPIQIAGAAGVRLPTGSNRERFRARSTISYRIITANPQKTQVITRRYAVSNCFARP